MAYVENRTIHDADSHVMELPDRIVEFMESKFLSDFEPYIRVRDEKWIEKINALHDDPEFRAGDESQILMRKNHEALGSFRKEDRPKTLDYLGFTSQLVFTTDALSNYGLEIGQTNDLALAAAQAHNRMMVDFCSVDKRLLATGYVPLIDIERAPQIAKEAIEWLAASQGLDFLAPLKSSEQLEMAKSRLREQVPFYDKDRFFAPDIRKAADLIQQDVLSDLVHADIMITQTISIDG